MIHYRTWYPPTSREGPRVHTLPLDRGRLYEIVDNACTAVFTPAPGYLHEKCRSWNDQVIDLILEDLKNDTKDPMKYKFAVSSTIIQHTAPVYKPAYEAVEEGMTERQKIARRWTAESARKKLFKAAEEAEEGADVLRALRESQRKATMRGSQSVRKDAAAAEEEEEEEAARAAKEKGRRGRAIKTAIRAGLEISGKPSTQGADPATAEEEAARLAEVKGKDKAVEAAIGLGLEFSEKSSDGGVDNATAEEEAVRLARIEGRKQRAIKAAKKAGLKIPEKPSNRGVRFDLEEDGTIIKLEKLETPKKSGRRTPRAKPTPTRRAISPKAPAKGAPIKEAPSEETPAKEAPAKDSVALEELKSPTLRISPFVQGIPDPPLIVGTRGKLKERDDAADDASAEGTTAKETFSEETHVKEAPAKKTPAEEISAKEATIPEASKSPTLRLSPFVQGIPDPPLIVAARNKLRERAEIAKSKDGRTPEEKVASDEATTSNAVNPTKEASTSKELSRPKENIASKEGTAEEGTTTKEGRPREESRPRREGRTPKEGRIPKERVTSREDSTGEEVRTPKEDRTAKVGTSSKEGTTHESELAILAGPPPLEELRLYRESHLPKEGISNQGTSSEENTRFEGEPATIERGTREGILPSKLGRLVREGHPREESRPQKQRESPPSEETPSPKDTRPRRDKEPRPHEEEAEEARVEERQRRASYPLGAPLLTGLPPGITAAEIIDPDKLLPVVGRSGRHSALKGFWDYRKDGMWSCEWHGGLERGFDVLFSIVYISLED